MKPQTVAGNSERGRHLMATYQCGQCHDVPEVASAQGALGPSLNAFAHRSYIAGEIPNQPETLARWIVDPASVVPGTTMPAMGVNARDAQDIVAFLSTLR